MMEIIGQIFGIAAMVTSVLTYQIKNYKKLIFAQIVAAALFATHYFMIGGVNGGVCNIISIVRNLFFLLLVGKLQLKWTAAGLFGAIMVGFNLYFWEGWQTVFICLGMLANTASMSFNNTQNVRIAILIACPLMLTYNIINFSVGGIINETLVFVSSIIGLIRHKTKKEEISVEK